MALLSICYMTFSKTFPQELVFRYGLKEKIIDLQNLREEFVLFLRHITQFIREIFERV